MLVHQRVQLGEASGQRRISQRHEDRTGSGEGVGKNATANDPRRHHRRVENSDAAAIGVQRHQGGCENERKAPADGVEPLPHRHVRRAQDAMSDPPRVGTEQRLVSISPEQVPMISDQERNRGFCSREGGKEYREDQRRQDQERRLFFQPSDDGRDRIIGLLQCKLQHPPKDADQHANDRHRDRRDEIRHEQLREIDLCEEAGQECSSEHHAAKHDLRKKHGPEAGSDTGVLGRRP